MISPRSMSGALLALTLGGSLAGSASATPASDAPSAYADCAPDRLAGADLAALKRAIVSAAGPGIAPTGDQLFADASVIVAPAALSKAEAFLVYVAGPTNCGTGGCTAWVLEQSAGEYRSLGKIGPARLPLSVLPGIHAGRHDIGVTAAGGGIRKGYAAALTFDGKRYQSNPTVAGVARAAAGKGTVVLGEPGAAAGQCRLR